MTKNDVKQIVKRYSYIIKPIKRGLTVASFEIGHRRKRLELTEEVKTVCELVKEVHRNIQTEWKKKMLGEMLKGQLDLYLWQKYPCAKNSYYKIKKEFIEAVYRCCVYKQMVAYEELMEVST